MAASETKVVPAAVDLAAIAQRILAMAELAAAEHVQGLERSQARKLMGHVNERLGAERHETSPWR